MTEFLPLKDAFLWYKKHPPHDYYFWRGEFCYEKKKIDRKLVDQLYLKKVKTVKLFVWNFEFLCPDGDGCPPSISQFMMRETLLLNFNMSSFVFKWIKNPNKYERKGFG